MARTLAANVLAAIYANDTDEIVLPLLTLDHPGLVTPFRLVSDPVAVTSRGNLFSPFAFEATFPNERDDEIGGVQIVLDNVDQTLIDTIRGEQTSPTLMFEYVFASDPDTLITEPYTFTLTSLQYNAFTIRAALTYEPMRDEPYPSGRFTPPVVPGLFNAVS